MEPFRRNNSSERPEDNFIEKVIRIDRITKVVKGGKRMAFRAFVISGDGKGSVGIGLGKSKEVPVAIKKAIDKARKSSFRVNVVRGTVPHVVEGRFGASRVMMKPAKPGTGVIAGGAVRILLEALGVKDIVAKSLGSRNPINSAKAALICLGSCKNLAEEAAIRGKALPVYISEE
jgi:small subunit ribosomal protein S5